MAAEIPTGTTIGLVCRDGIVLASERRLSYGYFVLSKSAKKIFKINNRIGVACAGLVADMQILARELKAYLDLYEFERGRQASVRAAAKLLGTLLFERRLFPYLAQTIVGGVDEEGAQVYVLDPLGSVLEDKFTSVGSGAEIAMGILEAEYKEGMAIEEGRALARKAIKAASARDVGSGEGMDILIITPNGSVEEFEPLK